VEQHGLHAVVVLDAHAVSGLLEVLLDCVELRLEDDLQNV